MGFSKSHFFTASQKIKRHLEHCTTPVPVNFISSSLGVLPVPACFYWGSAYFCLDPARFCWGPAFAGDLPAVALIGIISFGYALLETESFLWFCTFHASWLGLLLGIYVLFGWDHFGGFVLCVAWVSFVVLYVSWLFFVPRLCIFRS